MTQRTTRRTVARAGTTVQPLESQRRVARTDRPEPECRERGAEHGDDRRFHRGRQMERRAVVRHQHGGARNQRRGLPERQLAAGVDDSPPPPCAARRRPIHNLIAQGHIFGPPNHDHRHSGRQLTGQVPEIRPSLAAPDRSGRERRKGRPGFDSPRGQQPRCRLLILRRGAQVGTIGGRRLVREGQETVAFVARGRLVAGLCIEEGPTA